MIEQEREKKGKEREVPRCERERNGENQRESHRGEDGKRREGRFTAAGKRRSAGTHVESAKRSRSCVKCLDITVLFRPARSSPVLSRFCNSVLFTPACEPTDRTSEPTGRQTGHNPFPRRSLSLVPVRADLMTLPPRSDDDSIVYDQLK